MVFDRGGDIGYGVAGISAGEELAEGTHNSSVASTVTAGDLLICNCIGDDDLALLGAFELIKCYSRIRHTCIDLTLCAHDVDLSAALVEGTHGEGNGCAAFVFKVNDLMVNDVVVALINASAVVAFEKHAANVLLGGIVLLRRSADIRRLLASVDLERAVRAFCFYGTALSAEFGSTLGLVSRAEV